MNISDVFKTSLIALGSNKIRTFLTMLGVIIGVFSVIVLVSVGRGMQNYIKDQFESIGSNLIYVMPGKAGMSEDPASSYSKNKFEEKHLDLLKSNLNADDYTHISAYVQVGDSVKYKTKTYYAQIVGIGHDDDSLYNYTVARGRFFNKSEEKGKEKVVLLGYDVSKELFSSSNPVGKTVKIGDESFEVIGTFAKKGKSFDNIIVSPYPTIMRVFNVERISGFIVKTKSPDTIDGAMREIKMALLKDLSSDDFSVMSQSDILESINSVLRIVTLGIGAIAGISLIVGGIGIMNIMLVSVTERIKEIGLRKSLGATPFTIAQQFLMESMFISVLGGVIGIILGWLGSLAGRAFIRTEVPWWAVAIAFGFSLIVGIVFGTYPAIKAAKKDPIEALRYE